MKRFLTSPGFFFVVLLLALISTLNLVSYKPQVKVTHYLSQPGVIVEVLDPSLQQFAVDWQVEVGRRFPKALVILCHGGNFIEGEWSVKAAVRWPYTSAQHLVRHYQQLYPDRVVVLLACNVGHLKLNVPGAYYAHSSVWCEPDRATGGAPENDYRMLDDDPESPLGGHEASRWTVDPEVVGNVFEFISE
jgi:hypothetical protein